MGATVLHFEAAHGAGDVGPVPAAIAPLPSPSSLPAQMTPGCGRLGDGEDVS
jgi:hypothetical protein